jgi:hypothetical protein
MTFNPLVAFRLLGRSWKYLLVALVFTLSAACYQRLTGPTHPKKFHIEMDNQDFIFKTLRSHETTAGAPIHVPAGLAAHQPKLVFKRYPTDDPWTKLAFQADPQDPSLLVAELPAQPAAGKVEYQIEVEGKLYPEQPVRLRYKDPVPNLILIPHVYSMFAALLFGAWALLESVLMKRRKEPLAIPTAVQLCTFFFILGGFLLGPIVQKYAFGEYWTGFPFGDDFTDNKVLFSVIFWLVACVFNFRRAHRPTAVLAAVLMFAAYLVPHSFGGSQFDYKENKVKTGLQKPTGAAK